MNSLFQRGSTSERAEQYISSGEWSWPVRVPPGVGAGGCVQMVQSGHRSLLHPVLHERPLHLGVEGSGQR